MRKSKTETAETKRRILKAAAAAFRRNGIRDTGLADVMAAAGLTQGGFYRHFRSKDQLVAEACAEGAVPLAGTAAGGLAAIVDAFLSTDHGDAGSDGCPLVAFGSELARADDNVRAAASDRFLELVDLLAPHFPSAGPDAARGQAIYALSAMIGAATVSRIVTDPALSRIILEQAKQQLAIGRDQQGRRIMGGSAL